MPTHQATHARTLVSLRWGEQPPEDRKINANLLGSDAAGMIQLGTVPVIGFSACHLVAPGWCCIWSAVCSTSRSYLHEDPCGHGWSASLHPTRPITLLQVFHNSVCTCHLPVDCSGFVSIWLADFPAAEDSVSIMALSRSTILAIVVCALLALFSASSHADAQATGRSA